MESSNANMLTKFIFRRHEIEKIEAKIICLSEASRVSLNFFLLFRLVSTIVFFFFILYTNELGIILAPIFTIIYYILIDVLVLERAIIREGKKLDEEAIHFFQVLMISLEAGNSFKIALEKTTASIDSSLALKFNRALLELNYGKQLHEVLNEMSKRVPSVMVRNIIVNLAASHLLGSSMSESLNNQIDYLENVLIMTAKKEVGKIPIKISIVSVLIFMPLIMLLILAPIVIKLFEL